MNCHEFEPLIALYAGRDLEDPAQVEAHLAECPECRQLLEDLQSSQAELREWASEPVDAAFLATVRSGVLAGVDRPRMALWPWVAALAAIAIFLIATPRQPIPEPPPPPTVVAQSPPVVIANPPAPKRRKRFVRRNAEPLVVKMLTDDPDIVVIWLVDQTGD